MERRQDNGQVATANETLTGASATYPSTSATTTADTSTASATVVVQGGSGDTPNSGDIGNGTTKSEGVAIGRYCECSPRTCL
jgi:hypothetical protein